MSIMKGWHSRQVDFVLAYPQAPVEVPLYMNFPKGYVFKKGITKETHCLDFLRDTYSRKGMERLFR
jgi:hypothetical protein